MTQGFYFFTLSSPFFGISLWSRVRRPIKPWLGPGMSYVTSLVSSSNYLWSKDSPGLDWPVKSGPVTSWLPTVMYSEALGTFNLHPTVGKANRDPTHYNVHWLLHEVLRYPHLEPGGWSQSTSEVKTRAKSCKVPHLPPGWLETNEKHQSEHTDFHDSHLSSISPYSLYHYPAWGSLSFLPGPHPARLWPLCTYPILWEREKVFAVPGTWPTFRRQWSPRVAVATLLRLGAAHSMITERFSRGSWIFFNFVCLVFFACLFVYIVLLLERRYQAKQVWKPLS